MPLLQRQMHTIYHLLEVSSLLSIHPLSGWRLRAFITYKLASTLGCVYGLSTMVNNICFSDDPRLLYSMAMVFINLLGILSSLFFYFWEQEVRQVLADATHLFDMFADDPLRRNGRFVELSTKFHRIVVFWIKVRTTMQLLIPTCNAIYKYSYYLMWKTEGEKVTHICPPLYTMDFTHRPILYGLELLFQGTIIFFNSLMQAAAEAFFIFMYLNLTVYFGHLRYSLPNIFVVGVPPLERKRSAHSVFSDWYPSELEEEVLEMLHLKKRDEAIKVNLKKWVILHENTLKLSHDLVRLLNPLLLVQFLYIYYTLILVLLNIASHKTLDGVEFVAAVIYGITVLSQYYSMCRVGDFVYYKSSEVFELGLGCGWYQCSKSVRKSFLIIGERALKPIRATVYCSEVFYLGSATFEWLVRSIIPAAITFYQISNRKKSTID